MKRIVLDSTIGSLDMVYDLLARTLGFPPHFGHNLDALWDVLTTEIRGPIEIVWRDHETARAHLGADFDRLIALLRDVETARPDFRLRLE